MAETLSDIFKSFEKDGINHGYNPKPQKFLTSSNIAIDWVCGGGLPVGKIVEIYGKSGSGKTTLALQTAVSIQESGGKVVWFDFERAFDWEYAQQLGLNTEDSDTFIYIKPRSLEQGGNLMSRLIRTGEISLVVVDSIARMTTESELNGEMGDVTVADRAKALYKLCRMVINDLDDYDTTLVFLNHLLDAINTSMPGVKTKITPGGNGINYYASLRLECSSVESVTDKNKSSGAKYTASKVQVLCTKNRVAPPSRKVIVQNDFGKGFSQIRSALDMAAELGLVELSTWTTVKDADLIEALGNDKYHGKEAFVLAVTQNPKARGILISKAIEAVQNKG